MTIFSLQIVKAVNDDGTIDVSFDDLLIKDAG